MELQRRRCRPLEVGRTQLRGEPRSAATETGVLDLPTLDVVRGYRGEVESTEPLPFGVWGEVLEPGSVAPGGLVERPA